MDGYFGIRAFLDTGHQIVDEERFSNFVKELGRCDAVTHAMTQQRRRQKWQAYEKEQAEKPLKFKPKIMPKPKLTINKQLVQQHRKKVLKRPNDIEATAQTKSFASVMQVVEVYKEQLITTAADGQTVQEDSESDNTSTSASTSQMSSSSAEADGQTVQEATRTRTSTSTSASTSTSQIVEPKPKKMPRVRITPEEWNQRVREARRQAFRRILRRQLPITKTDIIVISD